jgi:voltage-gated potassium channel Kch
MKPVSPAATYAALLPDLIQAAREVGYALAPHGSFARDLDLIAVPWTEEAASAEQLIMRLMATSGATLRDGGHKSEDGTAWVTDSGAAPKARPHGRLAWSMHLGVSNLYLDVSVMPRR